MPLVNEFLNKSERSVEITITRIRHYCSGLNANISRVNIIASSNCSVVLLLKIHNIIFLSVTYAPCKEIDYSRHFLVFFPPSSGSVLTNGNEVFNPNINLLIWFEVVKKENKNIDSVCKKIRYPYHIYSA